jgi:putative NADPH-quinone reductase
VSKTTIIVCHPLRESLSHAVARAARDGAEKAGDTVVLHDLYEESFDPVLSAEEYKRGFSFDEQIQRHVEDLESSRALVIVHPDWWGGPPAVIKGWVERVLRPGVAFEFEGEDFLPKTKRGLMAGKLAFVFFTTNSNEERHVAALERLWTDDVLDYCGFRTVDCLGLRSVRETTPDQRIQWLARVRKTIRERLSAGA